MNLWPLKPSIYISTYNHCITTPMQISHGGRYILIAHTQTSRASYSAKEGPCSTTDLQAVCVGLHGLLLQVAHKAVAESRADQVGQPEQADKHP